MLPKSTVHKVEDKSYREASRKADKRIDTNQKNCSIGPCDVTSKSDLERLVKDLTSKENYLNLLSPLLHLLSCCPTDSNSTSQSRMQAFPGLKFHPNPHLQTSCTTRSGKESRSKTGIAF